MLNISIISFAVFVSPMLKIPAAGIAMGVVVGGAMQLAIQLPPLKKKGLLFQFVFKPAHEGVRRVLKLSVPVVGSLAVTQINLFVSTLLASFLISGSITYLYYATRLYQFPHGVFGIALATAILPSMSRQAADGDIDALKDTMSFGLRYILFINIPAAVGLAVLAVPITSLLLQRGDWSYENTLGTAYALYFFAAGLWAYSGVRVVSSAFFAMKDSKTPLKTAFISAMFNVVLSLLLMGPLGLGGLALANACAAMLNVFMLIYVFNKKWGGFGLANVGVTLIKTLFGSAMMAIPCYYISRNGPWGSSGMYMEKGLLVGASVLAGAGVYFVMQYILKSEELAFISNSYRKKLG
jgi:putative peptidoglycan lipid II flippase